MSLERTTQWMETHTGMKLFLPVTAEMLNIEDIAHALSLQCRYAGHTNEFYSVAEHCCILADYVWRYSRGFDHKQRKRLALSALLHDASEAYLVDIPKPIKPYLSNYKELEQQIEGVLAEKWDLVYPWTPMLMRADCRILLDERKALFNWSGLDWELPVDEPLGVTIKAWSWKDAKAAFLERFEDYGANNYIPQRIAG